jgi:hypothetical protein
MATVILKKNPTNETLYVPEKKRDPMFLRKRETF